MNALLSAIDNKDYEPSESAESDFEGGDITSYLPEPKTPGPEVLHEDIK